MTSYIRINNNKIYYSDCGKGEVVVLLHGYLESLEIWSRFSDELSDKFRVISFDIPGHGKSENVADRHSMRELAEIINFALKKLDIKRCFMLGHSMGGYLTLMFHNMFPEMLSGFSLFHSHPFKDTKITINKRFREIEFVKQGKKDLIAKFNIPNAFATDNINKFRTEIEFAKSIALKTTEKGIIANLYAMMNRPDLSESLAKTQIPFLYVAGKKDNYIDFKTVVPKIKLPENSELHVLEKTGHMGFIEEKKEAIIIISQFITTRLK
ncbi:MAG: alpha/beta hydrolase [Bacteroidales bacterium]|nr:alpha/beta hydrolase [Bacteroidales bacterium]